MRNDIIQHIKTCDVCQRCKRTNKNKYGLLPEKEGEIIKWSRVNVDLWGPKTVRNKNGYDYQIHVMTMVDPVTGWFELEQLFDSPTAYQCQQILDTSWLARYPRPREIGFDNGGEFKQRTLRSTLQEHGTKRKEKSTMESTSKRNPRKNTPSITGLSNNL